MARGGKGTKKYGRNKNRPTHQRYLAEMRWIANKKRKREKQQKRQDKFKRCKEARQLAHAKLMNRNRKEG